jgi:formylglycine-generating enzyme
MLKSIAFVLCIVIVSCATKATEPIVADDIAQQSIEPSVQSKVCKEGMIEVQGNYCFNLEEICIKWGDPNNKGANGPAQCLEFKYPTKCLSSTVSMHYCIDKYPYPNKPEEKPTTQISWFQAQNLCAKEGKRLCTEHEFTQACRGPENKPYPYGTGYLRDCSKCNCDKTPWLNPATHTFEELDKRVSMGSLPECKSDYGVIGLVGNNDRWTVNESGHPYVSSLQGGHAIKGARNRCSVSTRAHGPGFSYFETGTVCCDNIRY